MVLAILGSLAVQTNLPVRLVNLRPFQGTDLLPPCAGKDQELYRGAHRPSHLLRGGPRNAQLLVTQHTLALHLSSGLGQVCIGLNSMIPRPTAQWKRR